MSISGQQFCPLGLLTFIALGWGGIGLQMVANLRVSPCGQVSKPPLQLVQHVLAGFLLAPMLAPQPQAAMCFPSSMSRALLMP